MRDGQSASSAPSVTMSVKHCHHVGALRATVGMGGVAHMQDHIGLRHFFQRGAKRRHQFMSAVR